MLQSLQSPSFGDSGTHLLGSSPVQQVASNVPSTSTDGNVEYGNTSQINGQDDRHPVRETDFREESEESNAHWLSMKAFRSFLAKSQDNLRRMADPQDHNPSGRFDPSAGTSRRYVPQRQRARSWTLAFFQWLTTALLGAIYALILVAYHKQPSIASGQRQTLNAVTTGVSFLLAVNLTASLKTYARLMRWRLLALRYRQLEHFELLLSCDELRKVAKMFLMSLRREFPFVTRSGVFCMAWLTLNISLALIVSCISLTYGLDDPALFNRQTAGNVSFTNLAALQTGDHTIRVDTINMDLNAINTWAVRGLNARTVPEHENHLSAPYQVQTSGNGTSSYYLQSFSPQDFKTSTISQRKVISEVTCVANDVQSVFIDRYNDWRNFTYLDSNNNSYPATVSFYSGRYPSYGAITAWSKIKSDCGWGCTRVDVFIGRSLDMTGYRSDNKYYHCQNTVPQIQEWQDGRRIEAAPAYQINSTVAQMLAGALGWSGDAIYDADRDWEQHVYTNATSLAQVLHDQFGSRVPTATEMANFVSTFTTKAIAAIDDVNTGLGQFAVDEHGLVPITSQRLAVNWTSTLGLLGGIILGQLCTMIMVFILANQTVIRDDSPLSIAKLFFSLIQENGLGERDCMLTGNDIVQSMENPEVIYGWIETGKHDERENLPLGHIDVFKKSDHRPSDKKVMTEFDVGHLYD